MRAVGQWLTIVRQHRSELATFLLSVLCFATFLYGCHRTATPPSNELTLPPDAVIRTVVGSDVFAFTRRAVRGLSRAEHRIDTGEHIVLETGEFLTFHNALFAGSVRSSCADVVYAGLAHNGGRIVENSYTYNDVVAAVDPLPREGEFVLVPNAPHTREGLERKFIYKPRLGRSIVLKDVIVINARTAPYSSTREAVDVRMSFSVGHGGTATLNIATTEGCLETDVSPIVESFVSYLNRSRE